ncbi:MAG: zinc ribbon domain-containing protein [Polyangiaceae bacterium]
MVGALVPPRPAALRPIRPATGAAMLLALAATLAPGDAGAELQIDGKWRQGALREDFTVQQWLSGCGPTPQSARSGGGEIITIRKEGDELAFVGGGRVFRTNQCYEVMPTLIRETHSRDASGKAWRTRCVTPAGDPRRALLQTLVVATTDTHIDVIETGRYEISLAEGHCVADVKRTRSFDLVVEKPAASLSAAPPPPATTEKPKPEPVCATVGEAARLEVRPSRKLLKTSEKFAFRGAVVDEKGCSTGAPLTWKLAPGSEKKGVTVDGAGVVTVSADAPEGTVEILASSTGKTTTVSVQVSEPAHYDDLLNKSGLNAEGENDAASIAIISSQSLGGGEARAEDGSKTRRMIFLGIVGVGLVALAVAAAFVMRRAKRAKEIERELDERHERRVQETLQRTEEKRRAHEAQEQAHRLSIEARARAESERRRASAVAPPPREPEPEEPPMACPTCKRDWPGGTLFCPMDATKLVPQAELSDQPVSMCPKCKRSYGAGTNVCPHDGEPVVPYAMGAVAAEPSRRGKICPTCGDRFDGTSDYCGKDGTALVMLN